MRSFNYNEYSLKATKRAYLSKYIAPIENGYFEFIVGFS